MAKRRSTPVTLSAALGGFALVWAILFAATTTRLVVDRAQAFQTHALEEAVQVRGNHAADDFARSLNEIWSALNTIKTDAVLGDPVGLRAALAVVVGDGARVSWAGFADVDGRVVAASNDVLAGADVSTRP